MSTRSAGRRKRFHPASASHAARSPGVDIRIGSTDLIRNGSMMVFMSMPAPGGRPGAGRLPVEVLERDVPLLPRAVADGAGFRTGRRGGGVGVDVGLGRGVRVAGAAGRPPG